MGKLRPATPHDVPAIVALHAAIYPHRAKAPQQVRADYFHDVFFGNPWRSDSLPSLVYQEESGDIRGFLGVMERPLLFQGSPVRMAVSSQFLVHPESRGSLAAVLLLKEFFAGPQDLSLADGANDDSRALWERLGGSTVAAASVRWTRPLRPFGHWASRLAQHSLTRGLGGATRPLARLLDAGVTRAPLNPYRLPEPTGTTSDDLDEGSFLTHLEQMTRGCALRPVYEPGSYPWVVATLERSTRLGAVRQRAVRNGGGELRGWYVYYEAAGDISDVLQIAARRDALRDVLASLYRDALEGGSVAVAGRLDPSLEDIAPQESYILDDALPWMLVHSGNHELLQAILDGDTFLSRLEGEWWLDFHWGA